MVEEDCEDEAAALAEESAAALQEKEVLSKIAFLEPRHHDVLVAGFVEKLPGQAAVVA